MQTHDARGHSKGMLRWVLLSFFATLLAVQMVAGQRITPGQPARVTLTDSSARLGLVDSVSQDQIWFRSDSESALSIPLARVQRMVLRQDRNPQWKKGLGYGALGGAVVGGALWLAFISGDQEESDIKQIFAGILVGSGAVGGALAGAGLSLILARDRWVVVPRDQWAVAQPVWYLGLRFSP